MTISNELFLAILSMDAYNRGYLAAMGTKDSGIGGTSIGNATIGNSSSVLGTEISQNASFFAQSYTLDGKTIISYRGTDNARGDASSLFTNGDAWNGFPTGAGLQSNQAMLAIDFYKSVLGSSDPQSANVVLTGHSLGGGLAGYVAALYGKTAIVFDQMPFTVAASNAYSKIWGQAPERRWTTALTY